MSTFYIDPAEEPGYAEECDAAARPGLTDILGEAARDVYWSPDDAQPLRARFEACQALMHTHAYAVVVALEALRRTDPETAERVATHLADPDPDIDYERQQAWGWRNALADQGAIAADDSLFTRLTSKEA